MLIICSGAERNRTADNLLARQVLYQLSYSPSSKVGDTRFELVTPSLSEKCSNQLS